MPSTRTPFTKRIAGLLLGVTLTGGAVAVATVALPGLAGAATDEAAATAVAETVPTAEGRGGRDGALREKLQERRGQAAAKVAEYLGMTAQELREELKAGKSLADIAVEQGKTRDELVAAMNEAAGARIDAAVAEGKITAEQGEKAKTKAAERIEKLVDRTRGSRTAG